MIRLGDCEDPDCHYMEPHEHGFDCDSTCQCAKITEVGTPGTGCRVIAGIGLILLILVIGLICLTGVVALWSLF